MRVDSIAAFDVVDASRLGIAALIGLSVGFERERSGHATGPQGRFAGLRTFLLLGILGGCAGLLLGGSASEGLAALAIALLIGGSALSIAAYVMAVRRPGVDLDGTTEAAALVVLALGALAGLGETALAAATGAVVVLALSEKVRLHWFVQRVDGDEFRAGLQFAVLALVVLPLLPAGPILGPLDVRPRALWSIVLLFSGLNFLGYLARRAAGPERGYTIAGMLGGMISSTAVTFSFARRSRAEPGMAAPLAHGVVSACVVLIPRVLIVSGVLNPSVALALLPLLAPAFVVGVSILVFIWKRQPGEDLNDAMLPTNPLQLWTAIRMAIAFQVAMNLIAIVRTTVGTPGLYATGALLGFADVDALAVSMSRGSGVVVDVAARAIAIGVLANTTLKLGVGLALGAPRFRRVATLGLGGLAIGSAIGLALGGAV